MTERKSTLTVEEAAELLGIGRSLAYELAQRGEFPGVIRLGRRLVVSRAVIERLLEHGPQQQQALSELNI